MYGYAEKFKVNLDLTKQKIEHERGQQINFTPKIENKSKEMTSSSRGKNVYLNLYQDHEFRKEMIKQKRLLERNGGITVKTSSSFSNTTKIKGKES